MHSISSVEGINDGRVRVHIYGWAESWILNKNEFAILVPLRVFKSWYTEGIDVGSPVNGSRCWLQVAGRYFYAYKVKLATDIQPCGEAVGSSGSTMVENPWDGSGRLIGTARYCEWGIEYGVRRTK